MSAAQILAVAAVITALAGFTTAVSMAYVQIRSLILQVHTLVNSNFSNVMERLDDMTRQRDEALADDPPEDER